MLHFSRFCASLIFHHSSLDPRCSLIFVSLSLINLYELFTALTLRFSCICFDFLVCLHYNIYLTIIANINEWYLLSTTLRSAHVKDRRKDRRLHNTRCLLHMNRLQCPLTYSTHRSRSGACFILCCSE